MELLEDTKDIFETIDEEIVDQEATELIADWTVSSTPVYEAQNKLYISSTKDWNISKCLDEILIWTH